MKKFEEMVMTDAGLKGCMDTIAKDKVLSDATEATIKTRMEEIVKGLQA